MLIGYGGGQMGGCTIVEEKVPVTIEVVVLGGDEGADQ